MAKWKRISPTIRCCYDVYICIAFNTFFLPFLSPSTAIVVGCFHFNSLSTLFINMCSIYGELSCSTFGLEKRHVGADKIANGVDRIFGLFCLFVYCCATIHSFAKWFGCGRLFHIFHLLLLLFVALPMCVCVFFSLCIQPIIPEHCKMSIAFFGNIITSSTLLHNDFRCLAFGIVRCTTLWCS